MGVILFFVATSVTSKNECDRYAPQKQRFGIVICPISPAHNACFECQKCPF